MSSGREEWSQIKKQNVYALRERSLPLSGALPFVFVSNLDYCIMYRAIFCIYIVE